MSNTRVLTDEMVQAIKAFFPRYPSKQAVTLPALHIVNDKLRHVPRQAVVEIAELLDHLSHTLGVAPGHTTPDGRVTLEYAECLGACEHAPCVLADAQLLTSVSHDQADQFVKALP